MATNSRVSYQRTHGRASPAVERGVNPATIEDALDGVNRENAFSLWPKWNFYRLFVTHLVLSALVGGAVVKATSPALPYIDCLFLAASSVTSSGLGTVSMLDVTPDTFPVIFILMFIGCGLFVQLQVLIFRRVKYRRLRKELIQYMHDVRVQNNRVSRVHTEDLQAVIARKDMQDRAVAMVAVALFLHMTVFIVIASFILYGIDSTLYPPVEEVEGRGFSRLWNSVFLVMSSFTNCGITMSSVNLVNYVDKPGVYLFLCIMILAGNTSAPLILRGIVRVMHSCASSCRLDKDGLHYALHHPRSISYMMFDDKQTFMLLLITFSINTVEYIFFLGSTMPRPEAQAALGDAATIAGVGFFQTISTRNAGLQILDLRILSKGMLVVYIISMYISSAPLVRTMYVSEQTEQTDPEKETGLLKSRLTRTKAVEVFMTFQRTYLFRHTAWIVIFFLVLAFSEDRAITESNSEGLFDVFFEVFSAYGNVGISMGYPGETYSLSGVFSTVGKIVVVLLMLMGKCRGLPTHSDVVIDFSFKTLRTALRTSQARSGFISPGMRSPQTRSMDAPCPPRVSSSGSSFRRTQAFRPSDERFSNFSRAPSVAALVLSRLSLDARPAAIRSMFNQAFQPDVVADQDSMHLDNGEKEDSEEEQMSPINGTDVCMLPPSRQISSLDALKEEHEDDNVPQMLEDEEDGGVEISARPPSPLLPALHNGHSRAQPSSEGGSEKSFEV